MFAFDLSVFIRVHPWFQFLQKRLVKWFWEKSRHPMHLEFPFQVGEDNLRVAAKFPDNLPASSARRRERISVGHDGHGVEPALAFGDCLENRDALGAQRQAVGGVLHIAAGENSARFRAHRSANAKVGIGRMRVFSSSPRGRNQRVVFTHGRSLIAVPSWQIPYDRSSFMRGTTARRSATKSAFTRSPVSGTSSVVIG